MKRVPAIALVAWLVACKSNSRDGPALGVPAWLVARPGTRAILSDVAAPCASRARRTSVRNCTASAVVSIVAVEIDALASQGRTDESYDPFVNAAVTVEYARKARVVRGSDLGVIIPDGTNVFCPQIGWWNPPSEFFSGPRGGTRLRAPVHLRVEKLVTIVDDEGDTFLGYRIHVLDGDFAGERGIDDGLSPSCEPADRPGLKLVFHATDVSERRRPTELDKH